MSRKNRRKPVLGGRNLFLYGVLGNKKVIGLCKYHSCCLSKEDMRIKKCIKKKCKYLIVK